MLNCYRVTLTTSSYLACSKLSRQNAKIRSRWTESKQSWYQTPVWGSGTETSNVVHGNRWISWHILPWELEGITSPCCLFTSHDPLPSSCHSKKMLWNPSIHTKKHIQRWKVAVLSSWGWYTGCRSPPGSAAELRPPLQYHPDRRKD